MPYNNSRGELITEYNNILTDVNLNDTYKYTVFPTFLTRLRYHTVTHRDHDHDRDRYRDLISAKRPEMINKNSFGIVTGWSRSRSWTVTVW